MLTSMARRTLLVCDVCAAQIVVPDGNLPKGWCEIGAVLTVGQDATEGGPPVVQNTGTYTFDTQHCANAWWAGVALPLFAGRGVPA